jgi:replicative superfamily II helicase
MLRGLFIGIDKYRVPISRLSCARADALALSCLLQDNSSGEVELLTDADATQDKIVGALNRLKHASDDDLVIIGFSGHGTEDHRLVPVDADADNLAATCISLDDLATYLDAIPSKQLVVVLDCCFAGGFGGARVFAPTAVRAPMESRQMVERLVRGDGRVVLTASNRGEPALETQQFGHGLFTYHLLEALQGAGELAIADPIPLFTLLEYVTGHVVDSAKLLAEVQTPTVYGSVDGAPALPRLTPGKSYAAAFPCRVRPPATETWDSLLPYGFSQAVIDRWSGRMPGLNQLQLKAINDFGVLDGKSLLVVAPTSSGKTMIGELAAVREAEAGARAIMLLPMRALVNDKYDYMRQLYGDRLTVVRATGEYADQIGAIYSGQFDMALLTYEKFLNIITGSPWVLRGVSLVVVDEAQNISDPTRGANLEFLLTLLRSGHARGGAPQIVALSAVIGDPHGLERWLNAGLLRTEERPVPLRESVIDGSGLATHSMPDGSSTEEAMIIPAWGVGGQGSKQIVIPLVQRLISEDKKVIVFRSFKGDTVGTSLYLSTSLGLPPATSVLEQLPDGDLSSASGFLRQALRGGVGFHNADLNPAERAALEIRFRDPRSDLKVMVATTTLAMGINTPAEAVVIAGLTHPGPLPYSVAEYKNMIGRAGRTGFTQTGESYIVATGDPSPRQAWHQYVLGQPEAIVSHFLDASTDPQTMILRSLVVLGGSVQQDELLSLLENCFAVWQRVDQGGIGWDTARLESDLQALLQAQLLDIEPTGLLTVTELGRFAGESGLEVRSVTQVSSMLRYVQAGRPLTEVDLVVLAQCTVELDAMYLAAAARSRQEQARWPNTLTALGVQSNLLMGLHVGGGVPLSRAKKAAAALRFASSMPMASIELDLMQHLPDRSAAGPIRAVAGRTRDVIDAVATICRVRGATFADEDRIAQLGVRLEIGLPAELGALASELGSSITRVDYLTLLSRGVRTVDQIRSLRSEQLSEILGDTTASLVRQLLEGNRGAEVIDDGERMG